MVVSAKIAKLTGINNNIASRYAGIMYKVDFSDLPIPTTRQSQTGTAQPSRSKYIPNPAFLEQGGNKGRAQLWYNTANNIMTISDITIIKDWLLSGGSYTSYIHRTYQIPKVVA